MLFRNLNFLAGSSRSSWELVQGRLTYIWVVCYAHPVRAEDDAQESRMQDISCNCVLRASTLNIEQ